MRAVVGLLVLAALATATRVALESPNPRVYFAGWKDTRMPSINLGAKRTLSFALKTKDTSALTELFWRVSNPKDAMYGKYLTTDQITEYVAAPEHTIKAVTSWLESLGVVPTVTRNKDWVTAEMTLGQIQSVFGVAFTRYLNTQTGREADVTAGPYYVPTGLAEHLVLVTGITGVPNNKVVRESDNKHSSSSSATGSSVGSEITPSVVRAAYGVPATLVPTNANNSHAVSEFQAQYMDPTDLATFFKKYVTYSTDTTYTLVGTNNPKQASLEGSLDIQYMMGLAPGILTSFYSYSSDNFYSDLTTWLAALAASDDVPWVFSISYGSQGEYPTPDYRDKQDIEYQKLGLRGVSIIYASGDYGACGDGSCDHLFASYPAISVYVTSVGATKFVHGNTGEEAAVVNFKSGGGFDTLQPTPSYQLSNVQAYLQNAPFLPPPSAYNSSNRATPDVAALGAEAFQIIVSGSVCPVGGTSASAPSFAAIMVLLNDVQLNAGKSTLGFLNPWLYQTNAADNGAFTDITIGDNSCTGNDADLNCGFVCIVGWDPVTGLGTPNYPALVANLP